MMRLYQTIHADHEGGNVSAHATHLVRPFFPPTAQEACVLQAQPVVGSDKCVADAASSVRVRGVGCRCVRNPTRHVTG